MNNMEMEHNRQVVQDGLDKRSNRRKKAIIEAEQEVITIQMFRIVNTNANNAEPKHQPAYYEAPICKANKKPSKKLIKLRNVSAVNMALSFVALAIPVVLYFTNLMEMIGALATIAIPALAFIYNLCIFVQTQKKLKWRK